MRSPSPMSRQLNIFLDGDIVLSPDHSDFGDSDSDSDGNNSDITIEDLESFPREGFGYPLERMVRLAIGSDDDEMRSFYRSSFSSCSSESGSSVSTSSSVIHDIDFESLIDDLLMRSPHMYDTTDLVMVEPSTPTSNDSVMIKCLPRTSSELMLILQFNHHEYRDDPWNPIPQLLCAVEREDRVFLCLQRLFQFDKPPFLTNANYIDFFRQSLEGLCFLHEHSISRLSCYNPMSFMVDIGAGTLSPSSVEHFDRARFPVKYYFTNLSSAVQEDDSHDAYRQDVKECGMMIERLLTNLPKVGPKLKSLVQAMINGGFGAEDARKLFEALCKSLESSVFDIPIPGRNLSAPLNAPCMRRTRSHPVTPHLPGRKKSFDASTATLVPPPMVVRSQSIV